MMLPGTIKLKALPQAAAAAALEVVIHLSFQKQTTDLMPDKEFCHITVLTNPKNLLFSNAMASYNTYVQSCCKPD